MKYLLIVALLGLSASSAWADSYLARVEIEGGRKQLVHKESTRCHAPEGVVTRHTFPRDVVEHAAVSEAKILELCASSLEALDQALLAEGVATEILSPKVRPHEEEVLEEVVTLVDSGPSENRIDLVFMGDGYTQAERDLFFDDMRRLVDEMFVGETFRSQLPLFNIHLVFRPSRESGIGRGYPKNTAYGLYREGNTLRAIYMNNQNAARQSCRAAPGCDYPVVIGNDPYYGGLGGEFAISTSSLVNGTVVLRHELGHTIGRVGEEYDGGGYFGANFSSSWRNPKWRHWLTPDVPSAEPTVAHHIAWPWRFLPDGSYRVSWTSSPDMSGYSIDFSASGVQSDDAIRLTLDGEDLPFQAPGHLDRDFHHLRSQEAGFGAGRHELVVSEGNDHGDHWLSNITVFEYGDGYHFEEGYVNNYPVFTRPGSVAGYRPTAGSCLMREMEFEYFCQPCQENNWLQMMSRISLIDDLLVNSTAQGEQVVLETLGLGQFASAGGIGRMVIRWTLDGSELSDFDDQLVLNLPAGTTGSLAVSVSYETPEVRYDPNGYMRARKTIRL